MLSLTVRGCKQCIIIIDVPLSITFRFQHHNLIQLMGFCSSPPSLILPFMERLSLYHCLHDYKVQMPHLCWYCVLCVASWSNYSAFAKIPRLIIDCHGQSESILRVTACGLAYLHSSVLPFVHHNVKSLSLVPAPSLNLHQP